MKEKFLENLDKITDIIRDKEPVMIMEISLSQNVFDIFYKNIPKGELKLGGIEYLSTIKVTVDNSLKSNFAKIYFTNGKIISAVYLDGIFIYINDDKKMPIITGTDFTSKGFEEHYKYNCLHIKADNITCGLSEIECNNDNCPRLEKFNHTNKYRTSFSLGTAKMKR